MIGGGLGVWKGRMSCRQCRCPDNCRRGGQGRMGMGRGRAMVVGMQVGIRDGDIDEVRRAWGGVRTSEGGCRRKCRTNSSKQAEPTKLEQNDADSVSTPATASRSFESQGTIQGLQTN